MKTNRLAVFWTTIPVILGSAGCAIIAYDYAPNDQQLRVHSVAEARATLERGLLRDPGDGQPVLFDDRPISAVKISTRRIEITAEGTTGALALKDITPNVHQPEAVGVGAYVRLSQAPHAFLKVSSRDSEYFPKSIADALYVLKANALKAESESHADEVAFQEALRTYRSAGVKPVFPEAAHKFKVQAASAVRDKDFAAAADLYHRALSIAPWWAEGRFNRALLLSEDGDYDDAIAEMKRYLMLAPDAPNARAAQDKIYEWERKAGK